ncbi:hypothetical protein [Sphingomonas zeae]|nr:hypothetical protein [Sphingomonas zeae]MDK8184256.1 hypothetical protein [Sphingomonas zeae]
MILAITRNGAVYRCDRVVTRICDNPRRVDKLLKNGAAGED